MLKYPYHLNGLYKMTSRIFHLVTIHEKLGRRALVLQNKTKNFQGFVFGISNFGDNCWTSFEYR